jgi:putative ABC transport system ATP-binding protein
MPNPPSECLIQARGVEKHYRRGKVQVEALRGVDLDIPRGAFVVIVGPSGGGKTTLLHLLGGIDRPSAGKICVDGQALETASEADLTRFRRDHIGFVFQFYNLLPSLNALDNVILPLLAKGWARKKARQSGLAFLERVGLQARWQHMPGELSGGEQQRVAIARAMVGEPAVILADEPTGDLDSKSANSIISLMSELNQRLGVTFIVATHNLNLLKPSTCSYELEDGLLSSCSSSSPFG